MSADRLSWPLVTRLREGRTNGTALCWTPTRIHGEAADAIERLTAELEAVKRERDAAQFWLAELDQYGNPKLVDGSHERREGVEQASYLFARLGLGKGKSYACAEVILTSVEAKPHGSNEDALDTLNSIGLRP